jgi:GAF domain-containing protein
VDVVDDGVPAVSPGLAAAVAEAAAADLGQHALQDPDLDALLATATELVADTLDTDYCKVLDLDHDAEELLLRQGVGWDDGLVGEATVSAVEDDSQAAFTLSTEAPVIVEDLAVDDRFDGPDLLTDHGLRSGITTIVGPADDPWGSSASTTPTAGRSPRRTRRSSRRSRTSSPPPSSATATGRSSSASASNSTP